MRWACVLVFLVGGVMAEGCASGGSNPTVDGGGGFDATVIDGGGTDAGPRPDVGLPDSSVDASAPDTGVDAGAEDAGGGCTPASCDDSDMCTTDTCGPDGTCTHEDMVCNDGNACTTDSCDPAMGCVFTPVDCDDGDMCTDDRCGAGGMCAHTAVRCDDGDPCTTDSCDPASGCTSVARSCDDSNMCTADSCGAGGTCAHMTVSCDDGDACTMDTCAAATGCAHPRVSVMGDACAGAIDISAGGTFTGDSTCAANDSSGGCGAGSAPDIYFRLVLGAISDVTLDTTGTSFDAVLSLGTTCGGGEIGCDDNSAGGTQARISRTSLGAGTYIVILDGKSGAPGGSWRLGVTVTPVATDVTVNFPSEGDTFSPSHRYLWPLGAYVQGSRTTTLPSARSTMMHLVLAENVLTCDNQDMRMMINGVEVGRFSIAPGVFTIDQTYSFGAIAGPTYTLRYENVRQVTGGCGSAMPATTGSTVTLRP